MMARSPDSAVGNGRAARRAALRLAAGYIVLVGIALVGLQAVLAVSGVALNSLAHSLADIGVIAVTAAILAVGRYRELRRHQDLEQALVEARDRAAAADETKTQFLANMSHELRTPLNAIIGFAEVMENQYFGPLTQRQQGYVADIRRSGRHLLSLVDEVLDMARLDVATRQLNPTAVTLRRVSRDIERLLSHLLRTKRIELDLALPDDLAVHADEKALRQILINLISNAIKASPSGGTIRVSAQPDADKSAAGTAWLAVEVTDWGQGIEPGQLERLRAPFARDPGRYQSDPSSEGSGLGLAIADRLVRLHGGELSLSSQPGEGTRARLLLPAAPAAEFAAPGS